MEKKESVGLKIRGGKRNSERTNGNQFSGRMRKRGERTRCTQTLAGFNCISTSEERKRKKKREKEKQSDRLPDRQRVTSGKGWGIEEGDTIDSQSQ